MQKLYPFSSAFESVSLASSRANASLGPLQPPAARKTRMELGGVLSKYASSSFLAESVTVIMVETTSIVRFCSGKGPDEVCQCMNICSTTTSGKDTLPAGSKQGRLKAFPGILPSGMAAFLCAGPRRVVVQGKGAREGLRCFVAINSIPDRTLAQNALLCKTAFAEVLCRISHFLPLL